MENTKFNKLLKDKYFLLKEIAQKKNYNEELLDMITFIYLGFYLDFGKSCDFPLYDLFNKINIIYDHGSVDEIALKAGFGKIPSESAALTIFSPNLKVFSDPNLKQNPQTILLGTHVKNYLATPALKLEMLAHEVRHALMGYYKTNILFDNTTYYMRSGLQETYYTRENQSDKSVFTKTIGTTLDEITNTYITELLVNRIISFRNYVIENNNLKKYLESIKTSQPDGKYRAIGYNNEVKLLYPILINNMFINLINQNQFNGEISLIKEFIEKNNSICAYEEFSVLLDIIFNDNKRYPQEVKENNFDFINTHIKNINNAKSIVCDINRSLKK